VPTVPNLPSMRDEQDQPVALARGLDGRLLVPSPSTARVRDMCGRTTTSSIGRTGSSSDLGVAILYERTFTSRAIPHLGVLEWDFPAPLTPAVSNLRARYAPLDQRGEINELRSGPLPCRPSRRRPWQMSVRVQKPSAITSRARVRRVTATGWTVPFAPTATGECDAERQVIGELGRRLGLPPTGR